MKVKRYRDNCYAVVCGNRRGPCAPDRPRAIRRYAKSGLIASAATDDTRRPPSVVVTLQGRRLITVLIRSALDAQREHLRKQGITYRIVENNHG